MAQKSILASNGVQIKCSSEQILFQDLLLNSFSARSSVVVESQIWFWRPSRARTPLGHSMAAAKLCFAQDTPQGHSQAPIQKSRFHFSQIMVPLGAARALIASTNRYAFCSSLLQRPCRLRQSSNRVRTGSQRPGIFVSVRITKNISAPHFWFSGNWWKKSF